MDRRSFWRWGFSAAVAAAAGRPTRSAGAAEPRAATKLDPDAMEQAAHNCFLPGGRTCSEATLLAGCRALGIRSELVPDIALGLAAGVGLQGDVCGAVTGSAMAISLAAARKQKDYRARKKLVMHHVGRLYNAFKAKFGCVECRRLCKLDLTTAAGRAEMQRRVKAETCDAFVRAAARMLAAELVEMHRA